MIYSFWIFDRHCNCIFEREWAPEPSSSSASTAGGNAAGTTNSKQNEDTGKLLYGMLFSLRVLTQKLGHAQDSSSSSSSPATNHIRSVSTGKCRVHVFETASGLWLVLLTDFKQQNYSQVLQYIYTHIYVKHVAHNWLCPHDFALNPTEQRGQGFRRINNRHFVNSLESFLQPMLT